MSAEVPEKVLFVCKTTVLAFLQVLCPRADVQIYQTLHEQSIAPQAARRYASADGSSTVVKIAADLRPSADASAHLWWPAVAKMQAASVRRANSLGSCVMGQTDGRTERQTDGTRCCIMPPHGRGHNKQQQ